VGWTIDIHGEHGARIYKGLLGEKPSEVQEQSPWSKDSGIGIMMMMMMMMEGEKL